MGRRLTRRGMALLAGMLVTMVLGAGPALACGGLVGPGGTVVLDRTSTLAAYHDGVEHYITAFTYQGGGTKFGSIVPLPDVPTDVIKGGDWTLQRLQLEVQPPQPASDLAFAAEEAGAARAEELFSTTVDALDITVLRGGGKAVGDWAREHGFGLTPDAPEVLDFYAERSPIFMAVSFNAERAEERGQLLGTGTPVHITIPTDSPWVPLRILGLGLDRDDSIQADVFLLTDQEPSMLPAPRSTGVKLLPDRSDVGMTLEHSEPASPALLADLRSDRDMEWLPAQDMWLTYLSVDTTAGNLTHDLAVDVSGDSPSVGDAGLGAVAAVNAPKPDVWTPADTDRILGLHPWQLLMVLAGGGLLVAGATVMVRSRRAAREREW
jgi:Uncharacterized protein conserved in bacteria (DUF2330)